MVSDNGIIAIIFIVVALGMIGTYLYLFFRIRNLEKKIPEEVLDTFNEAERRLKLYGRDTNPYQIIRDIKSGREGIATSKIPTARRTGIYEVSGEQPYLPSPSIEESGSDNQGDTGTERDDTSSIAKPSRFRRIFGGRRN